MLIYRRIRLFERTCTPTMHQPAVTGSRKAAHVRRGLMLGLDRRAGNRGVRQCGSGRSTVLGRRHLSRLGMLPSVTSAFLPRFVGQGSRG